MKFEIPVFHAPDFSQECFEQMPNCTLVEVIQEGVAPENYHALSIYPEYFKVNNRWLLATQSRMDTVPVVVDTPGDESVKIVEFRNLHVGDKVVVGRKEDGSEGIFVYDKGFLEESEASETFAFRQGRSRETAFSVDYDTLYRILNHEKKTGGLVTWVLGSALSYDEDARKALEKLIDYGAVGAIICGNALATFDLEKAYYGSTWGQEVFTKEYAQSKNYMRTINKVRQSGSIADFVRENDIRTGFVAKCIHNNIPIVIGGTVRDRWTLPECFSNVYEAQDHMRSLTRRSSAIIMVASILFAIATGNMTPSYNVFNGTVRPVYIYTIDIQEFAVNKLADRGSLSAKSIVTNAQDFMRNIAREIERRQ